MGGGGGDGWLLVCIVGMVERVSSYFLPVSSPTPYSMNQGGGVVCRDEDGY